MDILQDNFLTQLVKEPTRESNILDLVLTPSLPDSITDLYIVEPFSDHNSINFSLSGKPYVQRKSQRLFYCYGKADWDHLRSLLSYIPRDCVFFDDNINQTGLKYTGLYDVKSFLSNMSNRQAGDHSSVTQNNSFQRYSLRNWSLKRRRSESVGLPRKKAHSYKT